MQNERSSDVPFAMEEPPLDRKATFKDQKEGMTPFVEKRKPTSVGE
jgi:hypothetical protein